jgi:3-oxoacyl-[acyl-carrier-protein] synthase-3
MDWSDRSVSILFGDGAGALVLRSCLAKDDELLGYSMSSKADVKLDLVLDNKNITYGDFKKEIPASCVHMNGKAIFEFGVKVVPQAVNDLLDKVHLKIEEINYFIPHQANQRIIDAASKKLGLKSEQVISNVINVGNTSAASIPLAIVDGIKSGQIKTPSKMILVGFGAGLTWGSAVVKWNL